MANKSVISLSGGLDSTMLLLQLLSEGKVVSAYSFDYGQKHDIELKKVKKNIKFLQEKGFPVTHHILNVRDCFSDSASSLHKGGDDIPKDRYDSDNQKSTVVEQRNVIFSAVIYGKALSWSKRDNCDVDICLGVHANDTCMYPDTTPESVNMARELFRISNWGSERVGYITPFQYFKKDAVLKAGVDAMISMGFSKKDINKVLKNTHSCYDPNDKGESCGMCGTCQERIACFALNDMVDPVKYSLPDDELNRLYEIYKQNGL